ncbi:MAG: 2,5-diamino-6-(ribosylamino)-4(3H)-pyrimidinone 5'-phosphate reductase [Nitrososphaera sp.]|uniref:2,5-diamino-6-(ribosylamino)-4(3H)-pyrimidinone 5'-phosphate reductase n=1 Tax=Nitrososphaera gargensis (strain Ga9.2) TaxID=1237085 RepID=K0IMD8_NITGG|nr:2,5-diamino-6-(ribosylamino)-4(3H)-pyrimidinone 5'-phosphate reductase [Candidatus Nitrososphaera gargensis]AFU60177.1 5-amino-6-(5-phosphoribosylamino)uracil reductase [Candidatus Nitrososphaera gargensis Ga9.2]
MRVIMNGAMTVDGKIATASGDSKISSKEDLVRVHKLRATVDAVVVGISTILADDPQLTVRLVKGKNPTRIIVDSRGRIPIDSQIMRTASKIKTIVAVTDQAPEEKIHKLEDMGAKVLVISEGKKGQSAAVPHGVNLKELFRRLEKMGLRRILVEGGGELNWSLLRLGLVDELTVTIAPRIAGGRLATTLVEGDGFDEIAQGIRLKLVKVERKKTGELLLRYRLL